VRVQLAHQPEVEHHHALVADQHVVGLEVAVQQARAVQRAHSGRELVERRHDLVVEPRALLRERVERDVDAADRRALGVEPEIGVQLLARDVLHGQEPRVLRAPELVQLDQVGVAQVRERAELALEAQHALAVHAEQLLERELLAGLAIADQVHGAHRALAQEPFLLVAQSSGAGRRALARGARTRWSASAVGSRGRHGVTHGAVLFIAAALLTPCASPACSRCWAMKVL
jgi:hypothetical protein